jgi:uracil phosphoribosyltransferase
MKSKIISKIFTPTKFKNPIIGFQSKNTRGINLGFIQKSGKSEKFIPARLNFGVRREQMTYQATLESLNLPKVKKILSKYSPNKISTVTVLRETLACRIGEALDEVGIKNHYGDAYIGATHIKDKGPIRTAYLYENIEGLEDKGLWVIAESFCTGRNLFATLTSLLAKLHPKEILFIAPIASRRAIEYIDEVLHKHKVHATYIAWGALFGVDEHTLYDMPWGHKDTEVIDERDKQVFIKMYSDTLCMGGDFGNNYFCPTLALSLYHKQLKDQKIKPKIPTAKEIYKIYAKDEFFLEQ